MAGPTTVHISLTVAVGSFFVSALSIFLGYLLIDSGTTGAVSLSFKQGAMEVNFFSFAPGVAFALFGAFITWRSVKTLIRSS